MRNWNARMLNLWCTTCLLFVSSHSLWAETITLTPKRQLTIEIVNKIASQNATVSLNQEAKNNVKAGYNTVMQAALNNKPVYGLTVGVGWNKDHPVFNEVNGQRVLSSELINLSRKFNLSSLRAHSSGLGQPMPVNTVRASMLIRLNTFLNGEAGVSPEVVQQYVDFLNKGITPIVPSQGSVGEADITLSSHIGLAMIGEWDVIYQGQQQSAQAVMNKLGIKPLQPIGKDFLSILSTNSLMAANAIDVLNQSKALYQKQVQLFVLMLEGFNGNIAPFSESATYARPYPEVQKAASDIRQALIGSDLLKPSSTRALQDPLSYRSMAYTLGEVRSANTELEKMLLIQINHSDDNPLVLIHGLNTNDHAEQLQQYNTNGKGSAVIIPTSNFNFLPVTRASAQLNEALAKLAEIMTQQLIRTENPEFTKLPRFLAAKNNEGHAFGAIQKPFTAINQKIKLLAQPQWFMGVTVAGNIEDTASMSNLTLENSHAIIEGLYDISAFQLLHAAQAVNLRDGFKTSESSTRLLGFYRQQIEFIEQDTPTTSLIKKSILFWKQYQ